MREFKKPPMPCLVLSVRPGGGQWLTPEKQKCFDKVKELAPQVKMQVGSTIANFGFVSLTSDTVTSLHSAKEDIAQEERYRTAGNAKRKADNPTV